jgi:peptide/nickel transport system substrate-binding protein
MNTTPSTIGTPGRADLSRRSFLKIAGLGAAATYLAGCGVGGGNSGDAAGVLRAAFSQPITALDPHDAATAVDEASLLARRLVFDTLVRRSGESIEPSLATRWEQPDEQTWVFTLRDGVKFHDGSPLTADDVVASLKRMQSVESAQTPLWEPITEVTARNDTTVVMKTAGPLGTLPINLTLLFIAPADKVDQPDFARKPIGSGPFKVDSFTPSSSLELSRAPSYWGPKPAEGKVSLPYIAETSTAITSLHNDEVDLMWPVPSDQAGELEGNDDITIERVPSWVYYFTWFNCSREPFTDVRVRQAMWHALDLRRIVERLYGAGAEAMRAPIPSTVFGYSPQPAYATSREKARQLLAEAGMADGFTTSMMWFDSTGPLARELAQAMISDWAEVGIQVQPESVEKATWLERLNALDWDMDLQTNTVTTGDADFTLGRLYHSEAGRLGYSNQDLDRVLEEASEVTDTERRQQLYAQACSIIWQDAPGIYPAGIVTAYGRRQEVSGFVPAPSNQPDLAQVSVA